MENTDELHRVFYNALLFTDPKGTFPYVVGKSTKDGGVDITVTDDFTILTDHLSPDPESFHLLKDYPAEFYWGIQEVKSIEKSLRTAEPFSLPEPTKGIPEGFDGVFKMVDDIKSSTSIPPLGPFSLNGKRLRKFSLLKSFPDGYPLSFRIGVGRGRDFLVFRVGHNTTGVMTFLDHSYLMDTLELPWFPMDYGQLPEAD